MKLQTPVDILPGKVKISPKDRTLVIGSCFADNVGVRLLQGGFNVVINPFGTVYNPISILSSLERLESGNEFTESDVVEMGAGAGLFSSFSHHSSFARKTADEFLDNANRSLREANCFWKDCNRIIVTLGTIYCYYSEGKVVSNCLKRPGGEFERKALSREECVESIRRIGSLAGARKIIWTVSPVRHLSDGARNNSLSKARLLWSVEEGRKETDEYFPAFEIMMDELRDYRFYNEDMIHPSNQAVSYIYGRFLDFAVPQCDRDFIEESTREWKRKMHRPITDKKIIEYDV